MPYHVVCHDCDLEYVYDARHLASYETSLHADETEAREGDRHNVEFARIEHP